MAQQEDLVIDKSRWDELPDSQNLAERDDIERRAQNGTLIVQDGNEQFRPVEVREIGWQLEPISKTASKPR